MKKSNQQLFLQVKQKLDSHRLPTVFPYEAVGLLSSLLNLIQQKGIKHGKQNKSSNKTNIQNQLDDALRHEIGKVVKQNNKLHMDLITAKQEIISLRHKNDKLLIERSGGSKQTTLLINAQKQRQHQLFQELTQVKFKYNELMNLVHQNPNFQEKYVKRLMKHKNLNINEEFDQGLPTQSKNNKPLATTDLEAKVILLQNKIANRESQIRRLSKKCQYDGLNMNKILKEFQNHRDQNKISSLQQRLNYLEQQNKKLKKQTQDCRKKGGSKQAIREQMRKNHQTISKLQQQKQQLTRKLKQEHFNHNAKSKQQKRSVQIALNSVNQKDETINKAQETIEDLNKKIVFLQNQVSQAQQKFKDSQQKISKYQILLDKIKNSDQGDKILAKYQIQSYKQRIEQLQSENVNLQQKINELKSENKYHKQQDKLKNDAIQNLQKIVDQLMKRNNNRGQVQQKQYQSVSLQNTISLRKNLAEIKQQLAQTQNQKLKLQKQLQTFIIRFDQKIRQNSSLNEQLNRCKIRLLELKNNEQEFLILQRQISGLQSDLKKQQNLRMKIDQLNNQCQNDKSRLRKQLQQVTHQFQIYEKKSKNHLNTLKIQNSDLEQNCQLLQLIAKQKDKKIMTLQADVQQYNGRIRNLKQQAAILEEQKLNAVQEKHKYQKRCEDMLRNHQSSNLISLQKNNEEHNKVLDYQFEVNKLHDKISVQNQQINQLNSLIDAMKLSQDSLVQERNRYKKQYENVKKVYQQNLTFQKSKTKFVNN